MRVTVSTEGVKELAADLEAVPAKVQPEIAKVVKRGAVNVKKDMQRDARSGGYTKHFARSINFDMVTPTFAEIGPDKGKIQGALGNILYFGTSNNAPKLDLEAPLYREAPKFEKALGDAAEDVL